MNVLTSIATASAVLVLIEVCIAAAFTAARVFLGPAEMWPVIGKLYCNVRYSRRRKNQTLRHDQWRSAIAKRCEVNLAQSYHHRMHICGSFLTPPVSAQNIRREPKPTPAPPSLDAFCEIPRHMGHAGARAIDKAMIEIIVKDKATDSMNRAAAAIAKFSASCDKASMTVADFNAAAGRMFGKGKP